MSLWQAIILGLVQGLTEFIPISSTAHLTLAGKAMGLIHPERPEEWTAFIAVIQMGTLLAVLAYFRQDIISITRGFIVANLAAIRKTSLSDQDLRQSRMGWFVIIGTIPIVVIGLSFKDVIEGRLTKNLWVIAASLIVFAILLAIAETVASRKRNMDHIKMSDAIVIGVAQTFALIPGASRSGTTLAGGLFAGLERATAARFSFLLSIPAVAASGLLEFFEVARAENLNWTAVGVATAVAAVSGYLSIEFLLRYLQRHTSYLFVVYRLIAGFLIIGLLLAGKVTPD